MREHRLGDDIDDFCVRCKRIMNHLVVSVLNSEPAKVRCRTCHSDHDYRHEQAPPPKVDLRKQALFAEVLKKVNPAAAAETDPEIAVPEAVLDLDPVLDPAADVLEPEAEPEPEPIVAAAAPKPKSKAKAKAKTRGK